MRRKVEQRALQLHRRLVGERFVLVSEYALDPRPRRGWGRPGHAGLAALLADPADRVEQIALLEGFASGLPALELIPRHDDGTDDPHWSNDFYGGIDAVALVALLAARNPKRYLEVGSGHSTRFARWAIRQHRLRTHITSIDPMPRASIDRLADRVVRSGLETLDPTVLRRLATDLEPGDVVLIDGSHLAVDGSDAQTAFLDLLPAIPAGVLVGIDDVFLPWDYPPTWADRGYAEQQLLAVLLLAGAPGWRVVLPTWALTGARDRAADPDPALDAALEALRPVADTPAGLVGTTLWMERTAT